MGKKGLIQQAIAAKPAKTIGEIVGDFSLRLAREAALVVGRGKPEPDSVDVQKIAAALRAPLFDVIRWAVQSYSSDPGVRDRRLREIRIQIGRDARAGHKTHLRQAVEKALIAKPDWSADELFGHLKRNGVLIVEDATYSVDGDPRRREYSVSAFNSVVSRARTDLKRGRNSPQKNFSR